MASIEIKKELPEEFLSDILITAFDGAYGASWNWFEPTPSADKFWLETKNDTGADSESNPWLSAKVRVRRDCLTGYNLFDTREGFVVDHTVLAVGISRIINDDYMNIWRTASERDKMRILNAFGNVPTGELHGQKFRYNAEKLSYEIETGETARGVREVLNRAVLDLEAGDIDANVADCIVQVGVFGKCIFG